MNQLYKYVFAASWCVAISFLLALTWSQHTSAINGCKDFVVIYARGSGQTITGNQSERDALKSYLSHYVNLDEKFYNLDASLSENDGYIYPAHDLSILDESAAFISRGEIGVYRKSVEMGKKELISHLRNSNYLACGTRIVLSGYSQGAQVIGEALQSNRLQNYLSLISYVALFGDPTLDINSLNFGNLLSNTPWYRGNATNFISGGALQPRNPYLPSSLINKAGSWCLMDDMFCTGNLFLLPTQLILHPHSNYPKMYIPQAAKEISIHLANDLSKPLQQPACGAPKQDVVLSLDISPSIRTVSGIFAGNYPERLAQTLFDRACDVRVAVVGYGDAVHPEPRPLLNFTSSKSDLQTFFTNLQLPPESLTDTFVRANDARGALSTAMDMLWRPDAQKAVNAFAHDPVTQALLQKSRDQGG